MMQKTSKQGTQELVMKQLMDVMGRLSALLGVLMCAVSGLSRVTGSFHLAGFENLTLFQGGIALMVLACVLRLYRDDA